MQSLIAFSILVLSVSAKLKITKELFGLLPWGRRNLCPSSNVRDTSMIEAAAICERSVMCAGFAADAKGFVMFRVCVNSTYTRNVFLKKRLKTCHLFDCAWFNAWTPFAFMGQDQGYEDRRVTRTGSLRICTAYGGIPAEPNSRQKFNALKQYAEKNYPNAFFGLGLKNPSGNKVTFSTGEPISYNVSWYPGDPNNEYDTFLLLRGTKGLSDTRRAAFDVNGLICQLN